MLKLQCRSIFFFAIQYRNICCSPHIVYCKELTKSKTLRVTFFSLLFRVRRPFLENLNPVFLSDHTRLQIIARSIFQSNMEIIWGIIILLDIYNYVMIQIHVQKVKQTT